MKSKDIIKALEYCTSLNADCRHCDKKIVENCITFLMMDALDLITNQQAEIDKLTAKAKRLKKVQMQLDYMCIMYNIIKTEAYKEFAVKLLALIGSVELSNLDLRRHINNLLKELTERKED